jgi:regulator of sirC expression with transglutaminase-like and TPR domain
MFGVNLIETASQIGHILKLLDDESPEIRKIVHATLLENSTEIILDDLVSRLDLTGPVYRQLKNTLREIHFDMVCRIFTRLCESQLEDIDLEKTVLLLSYWNNPDVEVQEIVAQLDEMAADIRKEMPVSGHPLSFIDIVNKQLFSKWGFKGNSKDYYNPDNSFIDLVLTNRTGIPISLSVIYILIARRLGLPLIGIPMPAHFIVKYDDSEDEIYLDPFYNGKIYNREECIHYLNQAQIKNIDDILGGCPNYEIISRMMRNIHLVYTSYQDEPEKSKQVEELLKLLESHFK